MFWKCSPSREATLFYGLSINFDLQLMSGNAWLIEGDGTGLSPKIDCSTSEFQWMEPRRCPSGFFCKLEDEGDAAKQIPNRGVCMRSRADGW